jgi:hypothetical protein
MGHTMISKTTSRPANHTAIAAATVQGLRVRRVQKPIASVLLLTMLSMATLQAQAAVQQQQQTPVNIAPAVHIANLSDALKDLHESLHRTQRTAATQEKQQAGVGGLLTRLKNLATRSGPDEARHQGALDLIQREAKLSELENQTRKDFTATLGHLQQAQLPDTILQRHGAAVKTFEARSATRWRKTNCTILALPRPWRSARLRPCSASYWSYRNYHGRTQYRRILLHLIQPCRVYLSRLQGRSWTSRSRGA